MLRLYSELIPRLVCQETGKFLVSEIGALDPIALEGFLPVHVEYQARLELCYVPKAFESTLCEPMRVWFTKRNLSAVWSTWTNTNNSLDGPGKWHTDSGIEFYPYTEDMFVLVSGPEGTGTQFSHSAHFQHKFEPLPRFCAEVNKLYYVTGDTIHRAPQNCPDAFRIIWRWHLLNSLGGNNAPFSIRFDASRLPVDSNVLRHRFASDY